MYKIFYYLIFGKFPCEHSWEVYENINRISCRSNKIIGMLFIQKCKHCGKLNKFWVKQYE